MMFTADDWAKSSRLTQMAVHHWCADNGILPEDVHTLVFSAGGEWCTATDFDGMVVASFKVSGPFPVTVTP